MKQIKLSLNDKFYLSPIFDNQIFELENGATEIAIKTKINVVMEYKLHVEGSSGKSVVLMNKIDGGLSYVIDSALFPKEGDYTIQLEGLSEEMRIISNTINITVDRFINARYEPTPEEETIIDKLVIKIGEVEGSVALLSEQVEAISQDIDGIIDVVDTKADKQVLIDTANFLSKSIDDVNVNLSKRIEDVSESIGDVASDLESETSTRIASEALLSQEIDKKSDKTYVDARLDDKASVGDVSAMNTLLREEIAKKQNKLTAGANITIEGDVISATGGGGGEGDVTKAYLEEHYYDKPFINELDTLVTSDEAEDVSVVEERDISYSNIPLYCGKWVDGKDIHRRVYVVTSGIAKGNTIKVADKPANMSLLIRGFGIVEGTASATKHTMTNSDIAVYVNNDGVYAINNFTGYAERLYVVLEYTVEGGSV